MKYLQWVGMTLKIPNITIFTEKCHVITYLKTNQNIYYIFKIPSINMLSLISLLTVCNCSFIG